MKAVRRTFIFALAMASPVAAENLNAQAGPSPPPLRPPAVPLVAHDPYFSIWSPADKLADADTVHWTRKPHRLTSMVRIDGKTFRLMGARPGKVPPLPQTGLEVLPTRTIYNFEGEGVRLTLTFMTPALPEDLDVLARPVTYVMYDLVATDGGSHEVAVYFDASGEIAVNRSDEPVYFSGFGPPNRRLMEELGFDDRPLRLEGIFNQWIAASEQAVLGKKGDDLRIDWGRLYVATPSQNVGPPFRCVGDRDTYHRIFRDNIERVSIIQPPPGAPADQVAAPIFFKPFKVADKPVSRWLMLAYDDEFSIQYMGRNLRPYWRRHGWEAADLLQAAAKDYESLKQRCERFDTELMADLRRVGGEKYARLAALAYRQCFAGGKFVADAHGQPLHFCKENSSNGCIGTADVFYPIAPQFLLFGPTLAKSFLVPFMNYAASERWKFPFAPHDLGTYPHANGQVYGGGERSEENQMPVEESGNLLILMAAVAQMEGHARFAALWWPTLEKWAEYLKAKGFDPENQLCTDDFMGHLAHNVNLSAKAILGLGAFAKLCDLRGQTTKAAAYGKTAREFAARWVKEADDGDHFRLAFDKPGTWSQKYNLIWDRILSLNLFPPEVARKEVAFYKTVQNKYGLPLDSRSTLTKLDWIIWSASLTQNRADFEALVEPVYRFVNETPNRVPLTDCYWTETGEKRYFMARPVVGAVFAPMLYDRAVWKKWSSREKTRAKNWAPLPSPPQITPVVSAADTQPAIWRYTFAPPPDNWMKPGFDDSTWSEGRSGFGSEGTPGALIGTVWNTPHIWLRREVELPAGKLNHLQLWMHHDEDAEVYVNGVLALRVSGWSVNYGAFELSPAGRAALKPGRNLIAVHCRQTGGGQYIDVGLVRVE